MIGYPFPPPPAMFERACAYWRGDPLTPENVKRIIELCEKLPKEKGSVGGGSGFNDIVKLRDCSVAWVPFPQDRPATQWLYDLLGAIVMKINADHFRFDLWGFIEQLQYTVYEADREQHYGWHVDTMGTGKVPRKMSFSILLSDPMSFEGGDLWLATASPGVLPKELGLAHFFPSYTSHRVTPVTKGVRRSLVGWVSGREFQ